MSADMNHYFYENWQAEGHRATIHVADCSYCNAGKGIHPGSGTRNGKWHGPFSSFKAAIEAANKTGAVVRKCRHCNPVSDK